jgi:hypothetical protein
MKSRLRKLKEKSFSDINKILDKIIVIDVETAGLSARPESFVFGCAYGRKVKRVFTKVSEMRNWLTSRQNRGKVIFAHNAEYDYTTIYGNILKNLDSRSIFVGSTFIIAEKDGVKFFNSLAVLKTSVEELGKNLGLKKLELHDKFKTESDAKKIRVTKKDIEYCFRDCEIVFQFLETMYRKTQKIKPTIASCAMEIFSKQYLQREVYIDELNEEFRQSYYGGRVECFKMGKVKGYKYDVRSLYPFVCTKMVFPDFENLKYKKRIELTRFKTILKDFEGCAEVLIQFNHDFLGCLPYRTGKETIFPVGKFRGKYNFNELRNAVKHGAKILQVKEIVYGERISFDSLAQYMTDFYELKDTTKGAEKLINKFLLNALTGKFAEKTHSEMIYFENFEEFANVQHKYEHLNHDLKYFSKDRNDFFLSVEKNYVRKNWLIPTISSYITSEARVHMFKFYYKYKDSLLYTDTDSLVTSKAINKNDVGIGIGTLKKEDDTVTEIKGNKYYHSKIGEKEIIYLKGVPKNNFQSGKKFTYKKMLRTKEATRRGLEPGIFIEVVKTLKGDYTKRIVLSNGKTKPIKLNEK